MTAAFDTRTPADQPRKRGRPPKGDRAMTHAERQATYRARQEMNGLTDADFEIIGEVLAQFKNLCVREHAHLALSVKASRLLEKLYATGRIERPKPRNIRKWL